MGWVTILGLGLGMSWLCTGLAAEWPPSPEQEEALGQEAALDLEGAYPLVRDEAVLARIERIGREIGKASDRPNIAYRFAVLQSSEINALSIPGGRIYVTQGLLDFVRSDDELAGVLAHEIAHNSHYHMFRLIEKQKKTDWVNLASALVGALTGEGGVVAVGQLVHLGLVNGYTEDLEREADSTGLRYLLQTDYNPVGMLTFMEHLAQMYGWLDESEMGVYRTHPPSRVRAAALIQELQVHHIPLHRRRVTGAAVAWARSASRQGRASGEVVLGKQVLFQAVATVGGKGPMARAEEAARRINAALDTGGRVYSLQRTPGGAVRVHGPVGILLTIVPGDAAEGGKSVVELGQVLMAALKQEWLAQRIRGL